MMLLSIDWGFAGVVCGVGVGTTFLILVGLILFIKLLSWVVGLKDKKPVANSAKEEVKAVEKTSTNSHPTSHEQAAIALAMHLYFDAHDEEPHVITIEEVEKRYSPWSSKIYNMRNFTK